MGAANDRSVLIHESAGTNTSTIEVGRGDADAAFKAAHYVRRERFTVQRHTAVPLEARGLARSGTRAETRMTVFGITKVPFFNRSMLASMLDLPESAVVMNVADAGGGFGVRGEFYPEDFLIPARRARLDRPVKWIEDRREHFLATNHSREANLRSRDRVRPRRESSSGCAARSTIDIGAYARGTGGTSPTRCAQFLPGPYRIPNFACKVNAHVSNKTPSGTYRGPGRVEANFFRERLIDIAAADLGIDPADIRRRNFVRPQEMPFNIGRLVTYEAPAQVRFRRFRRRVRAGAEGNRLARQGRHPGPQDRRLVPWHRFCIVRRKQRRRFERAGQDSARVEWDAGSVCRRDEFGTRP